MVTKEDLKKDREIKLSIISELQASFEREMQKLREERAKILKEKDKQKKV